VLDNENRLDAEGEALGRFLCDGGKAPSFPEPGYAEGATTIYAVAIRLARTTRTH